MQYKTQYAPQITGTPLSSGSSANGLTQKTAMLRQQAANKLEELRQKKLREAQEKQESQITDVKVEDPGQLEASPLAGQEQQVAGMSAQMTPEARETQGQMLDKRYALGTRFGAKQGADVFSGGVNYGLDVKVPKNTKVSLPGGEWVVE